MRIEDFLSNDAFTMVNKKLAKELWIWQAIYLQELISQRKRFWTDEFYFTQNNMEEELWISANTQWRYAKELKEKWLINFEKKGIPARNYYTIIDGAILNLLPNWQTSDTKMVALDTPEWDDYYNINNIDINKENFYTIEDEQLIKHSNEDRKHWSGLLTYSEKELEKYWKDMLIEFNRYYSETNNKWKQKWQLMKTWSLWWRLATWKKNNEKRYGKKYEPVDYENNLQLFLTRLKSDYEWLKKELGNEKFFELKQKALEYWAVNKLL